MADEIVTLLGDRLPPPPAGEEARARLEAEWQAAAQQARERPDDPDALIWLGRRTAYLGNFQDAIRIFSEGIARYPEDARFYRHRGHRYITVRQFDRAVEEFETAARLTAGLPDEVEPDGRPNPRNIPTSTLQFNIWYHLGLARYLLGQFESALGAYRECLRVSNNPDKLVATSHWLYMTLRRLGRADEAQGVLTPIHAEMDIIENTPYHRLLLFYRGELPVEELLATPARADAALDDATIGYGVGNWQLYSGQQDEAVQTFRRIYAGPQWAAFGYIAAEVELARLRTAGQALTPQPPLPRGERGS